VSTDLPALEADDLVEGPAPLARWHSWTRGRRIRVAQGEGDVERGRLRDIEDLPGALGLIDSRNAGANSQLPGRQLQVGRRLAEVEAGRAVREQRHPDRGAGEMSGVHAAL